MIPPGFPVGVFLPRAGAGDYAMDMRYPISLQDRLDLLVALPAPRLCQMLCVWSQMEDIDRIWSVLVWIESQRQRRPAQLTGRARTRWMKGLFPGRSLDRLLDAEAWFDPTVFELVTESVLAPLLGSPTKGPEPEPLLEVLEGWNQGSNHPFFAVRTLLDQLPEEAASAVLKGARLDLEKRTVRAQAHKQVAQLFHVLLYLYRRDFLFVTELVNLFGPDLQLDPSVWKRVSSGLKAYYTELKDQVRPKRGRGSK